MADKTDVAVILIGLNAKRYVLECLESIFDATWRDVTYEVIYIDNGSKDGSADAVKEQFGDSVNLIANDTNLGFCPAGNQGARLANSRYLYFINDDTLVVDDAIALTVEYMDEHDDVGTVGSRLVFPDGEEQYSGRRFPNIYSSIFGRRSFLTRIFPNFKPVTDYLCKEQLEKGEPFEVDWVSAAGQVVKKDDFLSVGGFAEDYYYWHEAVFCHRLSLAGKKIILDPRSKIIHYEGKGSGPRPLAVQRFHIIDFHKGAFRAYCERYNLPFFSITRVLTATALSCRGAALLSMAYLKSFTKREKA
ncbi:glycosyltransferase family 2 protein [Glaciecola sp. 1036]|uniref:glycosyltransferase family 2 protein n=1 Tax=Alteromonadaceae TaxID=72275 RepID=UPI003D00FA7C